jgi:hypothetical protein
MGAVFMSKFNVTDTRAARGTSPLRAEATPTITTHEGAPGYAHEAKSALFLLAVSNFGGEDTFYESAGERDSRYAALVRQVAVADPAWMAGFLAWLRAEGNMRTAPLVGALEAADVMVIAGIPGARQIVASVLQRPDEPGEALAYWTSHYGRAIPKPVKRGIADAVQRLYTERALLKHDTASHGFRFGDVIDLVHPSAKALWQGDLFRYALDRRHGREDRLAWDQVVETNLTMILNNTLLRRDVAGGDYARLLDPGALAVAGMTWEDALSLAGDKVNKRELWEAMIPNMGYMALLRNLRNFDRAGVEDAVAEQVARKLADPAEVARSRQFPYRFLAAYENAPSLRWSVPLDAALAASLANIPTLPGRSLVLVDTSASMTSGGFSRRSTMTPAKAAAVFGVALAAKGEADLYGFADGQFRHMVPLGAGVIREIDRFVRRTGEVGHGTHIAGAIRATFRPGVHARVFVISDMQTMDFGVTSAVPRDVALYGFNLGGYRATAFDAGSTNRVELGGLTDSTFRMIPLIEAGRDGAWPWERDAR